MFHEVLLCHPGYDSLEHFLCLFASDPDSSDPPRRGIPHQVALDACRIVANNEDGFLSRTKDRSGQVPATTAVLCERLYWYFPHNRDLDEQYPIVTAFRAWRFPQQLPGHWSAARPASESYVPAVHHAPTEMSTAVMESDQRCVITGVGTCFAVRWDRS